jgi:hypothetical protein
MTRKSECPFNPQSSRAVRYSSQRRPHGLQISKRNFSRFQAAGTRIRWTAYAKPWPTRARQRPLPGCNVWAAARPSMVAKIRRGQQQGVTYPPAPLFVPRHGARRRESSPCALPTARAWNEMAVRRRQRHGAGPPGAATQCGRAARDASLAVDPEIYARLLHIRP